MAEGRQQHGARQPLHAPVRRQRRRVRALVPLLQRGGPALLRGARRRCGAVPLRILRLWPRQPAAAVFKCRMFDPALCGYWRDSVKCLTTTAGCRTQRTPASNSACRQPGDCADELPTSTCSRQQCSVAPGGACCCSDLNSRNNDSGLNSCHQAVQHVLHKLVNAVIARPTVCVSGQAWSRGEQEQLVRHCRLCCSLYRLACRCDAALSCSIEMSALRRVLMHHEAVRVGIESQNVYVYSKAVGAAHLAMARTARAKTKPKRSQRCLESARCRSRHLRLCGTCTHSQSIVGPAAWSDRDRDVYYKIEAGSTNSGSGGTCTGMAALALSGQTGALSAPM